jgi:gliding motility-associated-like protein
MKRFIFLICMALFSKGVSAQCDVPVIDFITQPSCLVPTGEVSLSGLNAPGWTITSLPDGSSYNGSGTSTVISNLVAGTTYTFTASDGVCTSSASSDVIINAAPVVPSAPSVSLIVQPSCAAPTGSVSLEGLPVFGSWNIASADNSIQQSGSGSNVVISNLIPGTTYNFNVTNSDDCKSENSNSVIIDPIPSPPSDVSASVIIEPSCDDPTATIEINTPLGGSYSYSINGGSPQSSVLFSGLNPGSYSFSVIDNNTSCESVNSTNIQVAPLTNFPILSVSQVSDVSCYGAEDGAVGMEVSGGTAPYVYDWNPQVSDLDTSSTLGPGNYLVTVTDAGGCTSTVTFEINEPDQLLISANITDVYCDSASFGAINTQVEGGVGNISYQWAPTGDSIPNLVGITGGQYILNISDENGCGVTDTFFVNTIGYLTLSVEPFVSSIDDGMQVELVVTGATSYVWLDTLGTLDCFTCDTVLANPNEDIFYVVEGTNDLGCTGTGLATIYVSPVCYDLYVPNTFTPNGDLFNDQLTIGGLKSDCILEYLFEVYDRWGTNVFRTTDIETHWDGTYNGIVLNSGAFYYHLRALYWDQNVVELSGNCNIVK